MASKRPTPAAPPTPRGPPSPPGGVSGIGDPLARILAKHVSDAYGVAEAVTLDLAEELASPRGYVGTRNLALDRALGSIGLPMGRVTEISGWPAAGKSTMADQILAQCQAEGGIAVLADTERARNLRYMQALGIDLNAFVWIGGRTMEGMFEEIETLIRTLAHYNAVAWYEALINAGVKCPPLGIYRHKVFDPNGGPRAKPIVDYPFAVWTRAHAAAILEFQGAHGLKKSSIRDAETRAALRPVVITAGPEDRDLALAQYAAGEPTPWVSPADRPVTVVWDSVAGTPTEEELDGSGRDVHPATAAKVLKRNLRRLVQLIDDEAVCFILVNQRYEKIQFGFTREKGPKSRTYGGGGIEYHTAIRIEVEKIGDIMPPGWKSDDKQTPPMGQINEIRIEKNKVNSPFHVERYGLIFGRGAENAWTIYTDLLERGIIRSAGGWSRFSDSSIIGDRSFRGWTELSNLCAEDTALWLTLRGLYLEGGR